jgi:hypothetical protein
MHFHFEFSYKADRTANMDQGQHNLPVQTYAAENDGNIMARRIDYGPEGETDTQIVTSINKREEYGEQALVSLTYSIRYVDGANSWINH